MLILEQQYVNNVILLTMNFPSRSVVMLLKGLLPTEVEVVMDVQQVAWFVARQLFAQPVIMPTIIIFLEKNVVILLIISTLIMRVIVMLVLILLLDVLLVKLVEVLQFVHNVL
jgi:hypothetical protein